MVKTCNFQNREEAMARREQINTAYTITRAKANRRKIGVLPDLQSSSGMALSKDRISKLHGLGMPPTGLGTSVLSEQYGTREVVSPMSSPKQPANKDALVKTIDQEKDTKEKEKEDVAT